MIFFDFSLKRKEKSKNSQRKSLKIKIYKNSIKLFKNHLLEASKVNKKSIKGFKSHLLEANKAVHVYAQVHSSIYIYIYTGNIYMCIYPYISDILYIYIYQ